MDASPTRSPTDDNTLHFSEIVGPLDDLLEAFPNLLERENHEHLRENPSFREFLILQLHGGIWLHRLVRFTIAQVPDDPVRRAELAAALYPTVRSQLELLMTLLFLFDNHPSRFERYEKAGWAKASLSLAEDEIRWAEDPSMAPYLDNERRFVAFARSRISVSEKDEADLETVAYWPNPGKFRKQVRSAEVKSCLERLEFWLYDEVSAAAHFTPSGILDVGGRIQALREATGEEWEKLRFLLRSEAGIRSLAILLATMSEIEMFFRFGRGSVLTGIWETAAKKIPLIADIYALRWQRGLSGGGQAAP